MAKYAVWTKWLWPNGVGSAEQMQDGMKGIKADHPAEDIIWWHIDGNHHMSVVIYKTEEEAKAHLEWRKNHRAETVRDYDVQLLEELMGPVAAQMSVLWSCSLYPNFALPIVTPWLGTNGTKPPV